MLIILTVLLALAALYWCILFGMYLFQRRLLYHPTYGAQTPFLMGLRGTKKHFVYSHGNTLLTVLYHPPRPGRPTILYFHGNSGNLTTEYRVERFQQFARYGLGFVALSFRGFGDSSGTPSEQGWYHDARATIKYAKRKFKLPFQHMILFGESLGSGVAVRMAVEHPVMGLVLDSPYSRIADRAAEKYPWLPVRALLKDQFPSIDIIHRILCPSLFIHGAKDEVMPIHHGKRLFAAAPHPKRGIFDDHVAHVDYPADKLAKLIRDHFGFTSGGGV